MTVVTMPICMECSRLHPQKRGGGFLCDAFPQGIPEAIIHSIANHTRPITGDHGIQFDPIDPTRIGQLTGNPLLFESR